MKKMVVLIFVILLMMAGCGGAPLREGIDEQTEILLTPEMIGDIKELAQMGEEYYLLTNLEEEDSSIEIQLSLNFNPLTHEEVMLLTDSFASEIAGLFANQVAVNVAALYSVGESGDVRVFGESMFIPQTGKILYKHFGRDHLLGYGDP